MHIHFFAQHVFSSFLVSFCLHIIFAFVVLPWTSFVHPDNMVLGTLVLSTRIVILGKDNQGKVTSGLTSTPDPSSHMGSHELPKWATSGFIDFVFGSYSRAPLMWMFVLPKPHFPSQNSRYGKSTPIVCHELVCKARARWRHESTDPI